MPFHIIQGDITKIHADVIVNAANERLVMGGGVCGAIFSAAGIDALSRACGQIGFCKTGCAVITPAFALPAKHIIHTAGPVWRGGNCGEAELLAACYDGALALAKQHDAESIAFPLISSGIYGVPKNVALSIARERIGAFLLQNEMEVTLVVFDRASLWLSEPRYQEIKARIGDFSTCADAAREEPRAAHPLLSQRAQKAYAKPQPCGAPIATQEALEQMLQRAGESFSARLLRLIDERGMTDPEVYRRANIDRRLFSKIRSHPDYKPAKNTALALAVALRLNLDETMDLLRRAGYALSPSCKADLIVEYFLREGNYDIFEINEALFAFDESLLGS